MNLFRTGLLLAAMTALLLVVGAAIGGQGGVMIALMIAIATNAFAFWNSDKMVLRMHNARVITRDSGGGAPGLFAMVEELSRRADLPMPALYLIDTDQPNAFATGRSPERAAVAVTRGLLQRLNDKEVAAVVAHELAHIKNRDTLTMTVAATVAGAIGFIANFAFLFAGSRGEERPNPLFLILAMFLAPVAATLVQLAISRTREFSADELGARICGDPEWLASALRGIERAVDTTYIPSAEHNPATAHLFIMNPLHGGALAGLFRTHPRTEDRIAALMRLKGGGMAPTTGMAAPRAPVRRSPAASNAPRRPGGTVPRSGGESGTDRGPWGG